MTQLIHAPVHRSLHRRILLLGGEQDLVQLCGFIALLVVFGGLSKLSTVTGILFWLGTLPVLQKMAKADPYLSQVFLRHTKQQAYYPAHSSVWK